MNYYPHHIGDFNNATRHLTRVERSIYRDLIELYYDTEERLPLDVQSLCRKVIARTEEEVTAVQQVLNEFFTETDHGWFHARCADEILKYRNCSAAKSAAGKASAAKRAERKVSPEDTDNKDIPTGGEQPLNGCSTNQEPRTKNQEPEKETLTASPVVDDGFEEAWSLYPKRHGSNPKADALKSWNARRKEGVPPEVMIEGVKRFRAFMEADGKIGTEYVMQAVRFFGKSKQYEEPWEVSHRGAKPITPMNNIGVDDDIPEGFRHGH